MCQPLFIYLYILSQLCAKARNIKLLIAGITLSCGLIFCVSCGQGTSQKRLSDIEFLLDSRPDSALALIRQIDTTTLKGRSTKARFSLLHAAALDKNYIDTADTRIAQPAVDWYDRHGIIHWPLCTSTNH